MICKVCSDQGKKAGEAFTRKEIVSMLSAEAGLVQSIKRGRNSPEDLIVANSVISKLLLSFDTPTRGTLLEGLRKSTGMEITLKSCPHGLQVLT